MMVYLEDVLPMKTSAYKWLLLALLVLMSILVLIGQGTFKYGLYLSDTINSTITYVPSSNVGLKPCQDKCDDVLAHMTKGRWKTRPLTKTENQDIMKFLHNAHTRYRLPGSLQRPDGLCGNVTHIGSKKANWFRALCDPKGSTPCCYHNTCVMKSVEDCVCEDCYDMRHMKHAEYSTWIPSHPGCPYKEHSPQEACDILSGSSIVFVGDSLVRHLYTAMLLIVTGNTINGAMQKNANINKRKMCEGMYMFTEKECRVLLNNHLLACNRTVNLWNYYYYNVGFGPQFKKVANMQKENSLLISGIGIHHHFNHTLIQRLYLLPTLSYLKNENRKWPKLLWAANHSPGILKSPIVLSQTYNSVKRFNSEMEPFLNNWNVPIFDTFNLTDGMMSFDGEHYGMGMNIVKANIFLSYIKELRNKQKW